jgi:hypothetical protein
VLSHVEDNGFEEQSIINALGWEKIGLILAMRINSYTALGENFGLVFGVYCYIGEEYMVSRS